MLLLQVEGVDFCYDCAAEARILSRYLAANPRCAAPDPRPLHERVAQMMEDISSSISSNRSMSSVIDVSTRKEWFQGRTFDTETWGIGKAGVDGCSHDDDCLYDDDDRHGDDGNCSDSCEHDVNDGRSSAIDWIPRQRSPSTSPNRVCGKEPQEGGKRPRSSSET